MDMATQAAAVVVLQLTHVVEDTMVDTAVDMQSS